MTRADIGNLARALVEVVEYPNHPERISAVTLALAHSLGAQRDIRELPTGAAAVYLIALYIAENEQETTP